jgi:hypothetical protein
MNVGKMSVFERGIGRIGNLKRKLHKTSLFGRGNERDETETK